MAQPKDPPLSIRPGAVRLSLIDAHAKQRGITRHAAVLDLIDAGLLRRPDAEPPRSPSKALVLKTEGLRSDFDGKGPLRMPRAPIGSRLDKGKGKR